MRITRFFSVAFVIMAMICTFVLYASAQDRTVPGLDCVCSEEESFSDEEIYSVSLESPIEKQHSAFMTDARSVRQTSDDSSKPSPPDDQKAVMTSVFDSNISKKYSVVFNLRQYQQFFYTKLLIKSRVVPVDFVPLNKSDPDNTGGNAPFFSLNFGTV